MSLQVDRPAMSAAALDVYRVSPVRGQLEPFDPRTSKGWRYIQCTETPNELKVLLPPNTALMYEQLLKLETYELSKRTNASWERLMEIRHLKDRMIRKCQKLSKMNMPLSKKTSRGDNLFFQTFLAPSDFRCKEMEKWFLLQQKRVPSVSRRTITTNGYGAVQERLMADSHGLPSSSKQPMQRSITNPESSLMSKAYKVLPPIYPTQTAVPLPVPVGLGQIMSPPPLPVLLLSQREELGFDFPEPSLSQDVSTNTGLTRELGSTSLGLAIAEEPAAPLQVLSRRPSCIKRYSMGDNKSVSWADNHNLDEQLSQYALAAHEAQASGQWDEVRKLYREQIAGLEGLNTQVREGLDNLRLETSHLYNIEDKIRQQREVLDVGFQEFERKHAQFQEKVHQAFLDTNDARTAKQAPSRDLETINDAS